MLSFTSVHSCLGGSEPGGDTDPLALCPGTFSPESHVAQAEGYPELYLSQEYWGFLSLKHEMFNTILRLRLAKAKVRL